MTLLNYFCITLGEEIISRWNFFELNFTIHDSKIIFAIWSVLKSFAKFYFCDWLLLLLDFYYRLNPDLSSKELIFVRKSSTYFLKLLWRIFNYFLKIKFCKFRKKDILPAVVISVLDLIKTSVQGPPQKQLFAIKCICKKLHCKYWTGFWILLWIVNQVFFFPNYDDRSTNVLNQKTNVFFDE